MYYEFNKVCLSISVHSVSNFSTLSAGICFIVRIVILFESTRQPLGPAMIRITDNKVSEFINNEFGLSQLVLLITDWGIKSLCHQRNVPNTVPSTVGLTDKTDGKQKWLTNYFCPTGSRIVIKICDCLVAHSRQISDTVVVFHFSSRFTTTLMIHNHDTLNHRWISQQSLDNVVRWKKT